MDRRSLCWCGLFTGARWCMFFTRGRGLYYYRRLHDDNNRSHGSSGASRCLGDHWPSGRAGCDSRRSRGRHDSRRRPLLRNDLTRRRAAGLRRGFRCGDNYDWSCGCRGTDRSGRCGFCADLALLCVLLFLLFIGQDGLHDVSRLGDMREIYFGSDRLRGA
jgi:hypothetical protein